MQKNKEGKTLNKTKIAKSAAKVNIGQIVKNAKVAKIAYVTEIIKTVRNAKNKNNA